LSGRIDVGCAMSDVESRQIAASEIRGVIIGSGSGNAGRTAWGESGRLDRQYARRTPSR
jgi:hypothetical protein